MDLEDMLTTEMGVAAAVGAAVLSPPVRRFMRRVLVLGLAAALTGANGIRAGATKLGADIQAQAGQGAQRASSRRTTHS